MRIAWILLAAVPAAAQIAAQDGRGPVPLSLKRAVELALSPEGSTSVQLSGEALKQAQERRLEVRAALLPDVESSVTYRRSNRKPLGFRHHRHRGSDPGLPLSAVRGAIQYLRCTAHGDTEHFRLQLHPQVSGFEDGSLGSQAGRGNYRRAGGRAGGAGVPGGVEGAMPTWKRRKSNVTLSEAVLMQAEQPEGGGHGNGHRDHARQGAAGQRPAAPAGGAERAARGAPAAAARHGTAAGYGAGADRQVWRTCRWTR